MKLIVGLISCLYALSIHASSPEGIGGIRQFTLENSDALSRLIPLLAEDDLKLQQQTLRILADLSKDEETCLKMIQDYFLIPRLVDLLSSQDESCRKLIIAIFERFVVHEAGIQKVLQYPNVILKLHPFKDAQPLLGQIYNSSDGPSTIASIVASLLASGDISTLAPLIEELPFFIRRERFSEIIDHPDVLPGVISLLRSQGENTMGGLTIGLSVMASVENGPEKMIQNPQTILLLASLLQSDKISWDIMCIIYHLTRDPKVNKLIAKQKGVITRLVQILEEDSHIDDVPIFAAVCLITIANQGVYDWPELDDHSIHYGWVAGGDIEALLEKTPGLTLEAVKLIAHRFRLESFVQDEVRLKSLSEILSKYSFVPKNQIAIIFGSLEALNESFLDERDQVSRKDLLRLAMEYQSKNHFGNEIMRSLETSPVFTQCEEIKSIVRQIYKHGGKRYLKDGDLLGGHFVLQYAGKIKKVEDTMVLAYLHKEFRVFKDLALDSANDTEVEDLIEFWNVHITNPNDVSELTIGDDETSLGPEDQISIVKGIEDLILALQALNQLQLRSDKDYTLAGFDHELDKIANIHFVSKQKTIFDYGFPKRQKRKMTQKTIFDYAFPKRQKHEMKN